MTIESSPILPLDFQFDEQAQFKLIFESAPHAMIMLNKEGVIIMANNHLLETLGYSNEELVNASCEKLLPQNLFHQTKKLIVSYLQQPYPQQLGSSYDLHALHKNGIEIPIEIGVKPILLSNETYILLSIIDISERKHAEAEMKKTTEQLLRSNQELDAFAYIASHDLKEPLRGIYNYSLFLLEDYHDKLDQDGKDKLQTLIRLTRQLDDLINSLLYFSQVGRTELAIENWNLQEVLSEVIETLQISLQEKKIQINIPRDLPTILCDISRITEVFRNLITNAMKYNDKSNPTIEIGYYNEGAEHAKLCKQFCDDDKENVIFYVKDNGIGIDKKYFETIFHIFKSLQPRGKFGSGSGAGLTIAKKIVERHQGKIWLESTPEQGSCFYFSLPNH